MAVKIYTKSVSVWDENIGRYVTDEGASEWRWYDGAIALAKKGGSPPPPPDPNVTAAAQTQMNRDTSAFNNAITHGATYTPWGQQTFAGRTDPTTGATVYDQTISLDPKQQELLDIYNANDLAFGQASQGMLGRVTDTFGQPMDTSGLPALRSDVAQQGYQSGLNTGALPGLQSNVAQQGYQSNLNTNGLPALQSDLNVQGPGLVGGIDTQGLPQLYGADDLEGHGGRLRTRSTTDRLPTSTRNGSNATAPSARALPTWASSRARRRSTTRWTRPTARAVSTTIARETPRSLVVATNCRDWPASRRGTVGNCSASARPARVSRTTRASKPCRKPSHARERRTRRAAKGSTRR